MMRFAVCAFIAITIFLLDKATARADAFYEVEGKQVVFLDIPEKRITVSSACGNSRGQLVCEAFRALSVARRVRAKQPNGSPDPGAVICVSQFLGKVVIGKDVAGNENAFCRFSDGSLLDTGTLHFYGARNAGN